MYIKLNEDNNVNIIDSYNDNSITIDDTTYNSSLIITPNLIKEWPVKHIKKITAENIVEVLAYDAELIIFGSGKVSSQLCNTSLAELSGKSFEIMLTIPAIKTYNALVMEGRNIIAAIII